MPQLPTALRCRSFAPFLLAVGCAGERTDPDRIAPPQGTGLTAIDMEGTWRVTNVETLDFAIAGEITRDRAYEPGTGFTPPALGAEIVITSGVLTHVDGRDVLADLRACTGSLEAFTYLNRCDGIYALLDFGCRTVPMRGLADGGSRRLQIALGSLGPHTMFGLVRHDQAGAPIPYDTVVRGLHRVRLERATPPQHR
jgi:hypothetical protein